MAAVSDVIPPRVLSDLIGSIYDRALDPSRWDQTLRNIKHALDGHIAVVSLINVQRRRPLLMKTAGLGPLHLPMFFMHVNEIRAGQGVPQGSSPSPAINKQDRSCLNVAWKVDKGTRHSVFMRKVHEWLKGMVGG